MSVSGSTEAQSETQQLVPGIQDEITLGHITPKLPFKAIRVLSSVSRAWLRAIQSRQVYHARLCTHATETFVLIRHYVSEMVRVISLYSLRDNLSYELPPMPRLERGTPICSACVVSDGKVYVLGGRFPKAIPDDMKVIPEDVQAVFVLDLGGQWQWKQCASLHKHRKCFACAAMDGHIYALGGFRFGKPVYESEVYDPKEDKWNSIEPMPSQRIGHHAVTLGEEIFVHSGVTYGPEGSLSTKDLNLEVYHPVRGDWRVVKSFQRHGGQTIFVAQGKFHAMKDNGNGICVYDMDRNLWTDLHSHSFNSVDQVEFLDQLEMFWPLAVLAEDDDKLLAIMLVRSVRRNVSEERIQQTFLARCRGFGSENGTIVWEKAQCPLALGDYNPLSIDMYLMQL